ncbi:unnamed protein product [Didymodactylos carnosus]|uniref:BTB domain-containing protein n=1 Tax=Didymodactylos carnosus TaxID=1234261 RepID=A0A815ZK18_9BILA|nr:unnamed protein product [Didymodactylos carnosus]CAF1584291.1 unnamed protein product [Didymodactylos carnosus]CAF3831089.1 unnamed protein product [Didymodactylos carnosus]CAF4453102.1 unnamed protein product [Didymodactylos carnosus]
MNELWQKRTYPITFQLCTASKFDRVELYGSFNNTSWTNSLAQLTYAYRKSPQDKDDFVQLITDRYNAQDINTQDNQIRYHDVAMILYTDHTMHDIKLIVNDKDHFKAHRVVLAAGSDYFKAMFQSGMTESTCNVVSLKLDDPQGFPSMLKFLYTGTIVTSTLPFGQIESLLKLADMYQIPTLLKALLNLTTTTIDANNCLRLLFMQQFLGDRWITLRKECVKTAAINFLEIARKVLLKLLFAPKMDREREIEIFTP